MVKKDRQRAAELFLSTCKGMGFVESCVGLGNLYLSSKEGKYPFMEVLIPLYYSRCGQGLRKGTGNVRHGLQGRVNGRLQQRRIGVAERV